MKSAEEVMNILEAYDLTGSYRDVGELAGCSHHTVARYVRARDEGRLVPGAAEPRESVTDGFLEKIGELVDRSRGVDPRRQSAREDHGDGVRGVGADDSAGGRAVEAGLARGTAQDMEAVGRFSELNTIINIRCSPAVSRIRGGWR